MANVFTRSNDATPKPNRNVFDGSFVNNLTLKAGDIVPCFCKEVLPGDSFRINPTFGFNFQPFVFPVQTDMQASIHFFYVRNRTLWRGWENFITKTENPDNDTVPPYIMLTSENRDMFETGKIGDYLGVPTVYYTGPTAEYLSIEYYQGNTSLLTTNVISANDLVLTRQQFNKLSEDEALSQVNLISSYLLATPPTYQSVDLYLTPVGRYNLKMNTTGIQIPFSQVGDIFFSLCKSYKLLPSNATTVANYPLFGYIILRDKYTGKVLTSATYSSEATSQNQQGTAQLYNNVYIKPLDSTVNLINDRLVFAMPYDEEYKPSANYELLFIPLKVSEQEYYGDSISQLTITTIVDGGLGYENGDRSLSDLPFVSQDNPEGLRISAMPFRAVDACYNSFYRDDRNNPLIIDGKPYYNIWSLSREGGADTRHYQLYKRNWEQDVFTTAVQSPQQGVAPLIGVTSTGRMTFQDEEGNTYTLQATVGEDGHTLTGISSYSSDMPVGTLRAMVDMISSGISINDFRNVNALQRWLETNMRKGLRYKDQIEAHFGTSPTYSDLQMPEFIGGVSRRVSVNKVVQTTDTGDTPLGTLAGNATVLGEGQSISHYCDEHGWIIGFVSIVPKPVYSQQLNKQLLKSELLDYYFPEFAHIGYQPILNQELAPLQCKDEEGKRLSDVFGYQRAWYEYLANVDEVHGNFRNSLRNYIINRVFSDVPQLSTEFLLVTDKEVNEVFAVKDTDDDKIFGQIYFDVKMKRPIPKLGIPKLEVG